MLIKMPPTYSFYLKRYREIYQKAPTAIERTEAFYAVASDEIPYWMK
jgi:hypothetical protein